MAEQKHEELTDLEKWLVRDASGESQPKLTKYAIGLKTGTRILVDLEDGAWFVGYVADAVDERTNLRVQPRGMFIAASEIEFVAPADTVVRERSRPR